MKKIGDSKIFAAICLIVGLVALASVVVQTAFPSLIFPDSLEFFGTGISLLAYFTILSNIFTGLWLIIFAVYVFFKTKALRFILNPVLQGALTLYIFITGVVYFGILTWAMDFDFETTVLYEIVNYINHLIMPLFFTTIWFLPNNEKKLAFKDTLLWLIFPLIYFIFSMIRGAFTNFYPYPFLDPNILGQLWNFLNGYFMVGVAFVLLVGVFIGIGYLLMLLRNKIISKYGGKLIDIKH